MTNQFNKELKNIDIKILGVYLLIVSSILYLIIFYKQRAQIYDKYFNTSYSNYYPDIKDFTKIISIMLVIANGIFLYYGYLDLQENINRYKKTGDKASLDVHYNSFYANFLQFIASLIVAYNVFIKGSEDITVIR